MAKAIYTNKSGDTIVREVFPFDVKATIVKVEQQYWQRKYDAAYITARGEDGTTYFGSIFGDRIFPSRPAISVKEGMNVRIKGNNHPMWINDQEGNPMKVNRYIFHEMVINA